ncbi:MAG: ATP-binding protein [Anaerolineae bacterium]|nr:ATP-binding protein [Anaerolineae bacterium]
MAHEITIHKFGPIKNAEFVVQDFMILIGPQASGKSTISKLIYFFLNIRDELFDFVEDEIDKNQDKFSKLRFTKRLNQRLLDFFKTQPHHPDLNVSYKFSSTTSIAMKKKPGHDYLYFDYSLTLNKKINEIYDNYFNHITTNKPKAIFDSQNQRDRRVAGQKLYAELCQLFNFSDEIVYIPAGRSFISILSGQLQGLRPFTFDYPLGRFIDRVNSSKKVFEKSLKNIVREYVATRLIPPDSQKIDPLINLMKQILKGEYQEHIDGGRIYINNNDFVKINVASSGQQESLWILLLLFLIALEKTKAHIFIEEPEAHLYPIAQKDMMALICCLHNQFQNRVFITTHSPYIMASANDHIYAGKLGPMNPNAVAEIVPQSQWVDPMMVSGYLVENGVLEDIFDSKFAMFKTEFLDRVSAEINDAYDQLMELDNAAE